MLRLAGRVLSKVVPGSPVCSVLGVEAQLGSLQAGTAQVSRKLREGGCSAHGKAPSLHARTTQGPDLPLSACQESNSRTKSYGALPCASYCSKQFRYNNPVNS